MINWPALLRDGNTAYSAGNSYPTGACYPWLASNYAHKHPFCDIVGPYCKIVWSKSGYEVKFYWCFREVSIKLKFTVKDMVHWVMSIPATDRKLFSLLCSSNILKPTSSFLGGWTFTLVRKKICMWKCNISKFCPKMVFLFFQTIILNPRER